MALALTADERQMYTEFMSDFPQCVACGWSGGYRDWMLPRLENAHIRGGHARTHDRRNILRLCNGCHRLAHGERIVVFGSALPELSTANMLWLKAAYDPGHYDWDYLHEIRPIPADEQSIKKPASWFFDVRKGSRYRYVESEIVSPKKSEPDNVETKIILTLRGTEKDRQKIDSDAKYANQSRNQWARTCLKLDD